MAHRGPRFSVLILVAAAAGGLVFGEVPLFGQSLAGEPKQRGGFPASGDQPIEINADRLDVMQDKQIAIFSGNVDALQGDIRLNADSLRVHYRKQPAKGAAQADDGSFGRSISQIDAIGKVLVTSPEEKARGDRGIYLVDQRVIILEGNVELARAGNVLKGQRATMNIDSGRAVMDQGRVRGVFVPQRKEQRP
jgi:lipopolysaccharide export system protein LptA